MALGPGIEPGPHWWEASALTTAPSLLPLKGTAKAPTVDPFEEEHLKGYQNHIFNP